jgi:hypothetical protein
MSGEIIILIIATVAVFFIFGVFIVAIYAAIYLSGIQSKIEDEIERNKTCKK